MLDSLAVFAGVGDVLRAEADAAISLSIDGPFASRLPGGDGNLAVRAARRLAGAGQGAALRLTKNLPVASGIGGGSADAAAALRIIHRLWHQDQDLFEVGLSLGADVPVCVSSRPARMRGIGETLSRAPRLPPCGMVLVNPGIAVATADAFRAREGAFSASAVLAESWPDALAMARDLRALRNDLQEPALRLCPAIAAVLDALQASTGCLLARMSGSGATCFGLFASESEAAEVAARIRRPGWWCWGGGLYERG